MLAELFNLATNGIILPVLVYLALRLRAVEISNQKVLDWLQEKCPQCGAVRIFTDPN